ncbi:MAG: FecR domain-containing protein [Pseudomonadota bacterium]
MPASDTDINEEIRQTAHQWRARISAGGFSDVERNEFERWRDSDPRHALAYDRAVTFYSALGEINRTDYHQEIFKPLLRERFFRAYRNGVHWFRTKPRIATIGTFSTISVVFAILVLPYILEIDGTDLPSTEVTEIYSTPKNDIREITLSDGTAITLGAAAEIEVSFSDVERVATVVSGAALFTVTKDEARPFSVRAGDLTATVLGTSFDVRNSGGIYRVAVAEGQVEISFPIIWEGQSSSILTKKKLQPGQQVSASSSDGLSNATPIELEDVAAWRDRRLIYKRATIAELLADANRYDDRQIEIEPGSAGIGDLRVSGSFKGDDIDRMLLTLQDIHPIDVDMTLPDRVILRRRR